MADPVALGPTLAQSPATGAGERLAAGARAGEYVIERFLGAGAMGEVYAGRHPVIGKRVAIKVLRRELAASEEAATRFIREAQAVNQIEHANVVDVFAFGRLDDGRLYLAMDLVDGRSLRQIVGEGPVPVGDALVILGAIADALDAAHARGVVHRDLKPDNIMVSDAVPPRVFVLDFGIAKLVSGASPSGPGTLTGHGTWLGTPGYMAPEQWSADGAGPASDRYALGVIAFELLAGALPFTASSVPAMMEQHFRTPVPALSSRGAVSTPPAIDAALRCALAKDPEARFATARELVDALRAAGGGIAAAPRAATRRPWQPAAAGVGVLGLAVIAGFAIRGSGDAGHDPDPVRDDRAGAPAGTVRIDVVSMPDKAKLSDGNRVIGTTPAHVFAKPGSALALVLRKPGYLVDRRTITAGPGESVVTVELTSVDRFKGVWRLPDGELRALERNADQVDIYKLDEVNGPREFYRHYAFAPSETGIAFAADDEIVDARAPEDPKCHVAVHVEYRYDPEHDTLELRRDKVAIDVIDSRDLGPAGGAAEGRRGSIDSRDLGPAGSAAEGRRGSIDRHCVVRSRDVEPSQLVRVDVDRAPETHLAPAGRPVLTKIQRPRPKTTTPLDTVGQKATSPYTDTKANSAENMFQGDSQQGANAPPPQAPQQQSIPQK